MEVRGYRTVIILVVSSRTITGADGASLSNWLIAVNCPSNSKLGYITSIGRWYSITVLGASACRNGKAVDQVTKSGASHGNFSKLQASIRLVRKVSALSNSICWISIW